jgi:hypothetical protein
MMKSVTYDFATARQELQAVISTKGKDYVYPHTGGECVYFEENKPSCIIGHLLAKHDIDRWDLALDQGDYNCSASVLNLEGAGFLVLDGDSREFLTEVQFFQDKGVPWGLAVEAATWRHGERQRGEEQVDRSIYTDTLLHRVKVARES